MQLKFLVAVVLSSAVSSTLGQAINVSSAASVLSNINSNIAAITSVIPNPGSVIQSVTSAIGSKATDYASRIADAKSDVKSALASYVSVPAYSSIISGFDAAAASGAAQASSYVSNLSNLPSSIDGSFRTAVASALSSAAADLVGNDPNETSDPTETSDGKTPASPSTSSPGAGSKVALVGSMMGAAALLAVALAL